MGHEVGQSNAAWLFEKFPVDDPLVSLKKAYVYYQAAAEQNNVQALLRLGDFFYYGLAGVKVNFQTAFNYYRAASDLGNAHATWNLGYMHEWGIGTSKDLHLAKRYYDIFHLLLRFFKLENFDTER